MLVVSFFGKAHWIGDAKYDYYKALDSKFGKYYQLEELLETKAMYKFDDTDVNNQVTRSIVSGLKGDKYAEYFTAAEYENLRKKLYDSYTGVGISCVESGGKVVVSAVIANGPASDAGIKVGDVITEVDGKKIRTLDAANDATCGKNGTKVVIKTTRAGKSHRYTLYRTKVEMESVSYKGYNKKQGIGYIKISSFRKGTADEFETAVKDLKTRGYTKLIIDLRGNGGGITKEGISVADQLLPSCKIVTCKIKGSKDKVYNSDASDIGMKYVILVDGKTASSSEIVTAAVKDNDGGKIIGKKTYGKGLIQKIQSFDDGSAIKYTVGEYYTPDGHNINEKGIAPDIEANSSNIYSKAVSALK